MNAVTISREFGSDGRTVAQRVAKELGFENVDKELLVEVARQAKVPISEIERYDEKPEHPALRILRKFLTPGYADTLTGLSEYEWWATATVPELPSEKDKAIVTLDEEVYVKLVGEVMCRLSEQGKVVLLGRGSQGLLAGRLNVLHVRVVAPRDYKLKVAKEREGLDEDEAIKRMKVVDDNRRLHVKRHYNLDWADPRLYHLVVNTGFLGVEGAVDVICSAARGNF